MDVNKQEIPPKWFGLFKINTLIEIICSDCIKDPSKKEKWQGKVK